jgi:hypothetical protein
VAGVLLAKILDNRIQNSSIRLASYDGIRVIFVDVSSALGDGKADVLFPWI